MNTLYNVRRRGQFVTRFFHLERKKQIENRSNCLSVGSWVAAIKTGPGQVLSKTTRLLSDAAKRSQWQSVGALLDQLQVPLGVGSLVEGKK